MPVYRVQIEGLEKAKIVRADTAAQARNYVVQVDAIKADELADLIESGATIERVDQAIPSKE